MALKQAIKLGAIGFGIALLFFTGGRFVKSGHKEDSASQVVQVLPRSFDITVNTVGLLDAATSYTVSSAVRGDKGKIVHIIDDGTRVNQGDSLIRLDSTPFEEEVHRLSAEMKSLEAAVESMQQVLEWEKNQCDREILTAEFELKVAELDLKKLIKGEGPIQTAQYREEMEKTQDEWVRYESYITELEALAKERQMRFSEIHLAKEKAVELKKKHEHASAKFTNYTENVLPSQVEGAKAKVKKGEILIEQTKKGSIYKIAKAISAVKEAENKLKTTKASLQRAQDELEKTCIRAPIAGIAVLHEAFRDGQNRKPRVGDQVWQNQPLLYLPDISSMIVKTQVREVDLHKVAVGMKCAVTIDAFPNNRFDGKVEFIGILASKRIEGGAGEKYFQVQIKIENKEMKLRPGMTSRVTILSDRCQNSLAIPLTALFHEAGSIYCYKFTGNGFEKIQVQTGRKNEDWIEILSGLKAGDNVSLIRPEDIGMKG